MTAVLLPLYRVRGILVAIAVVVLLVVAVTRWMPIPPEFATVRPSAAIGAIVLAAVALLLGLFGSRLLPEHPTRAVHAPVEGRWLALNSPATKVPSHGTRASGQAYAIDLVAEPDDAPRPEFGTGGAWREVRDYPAFGAPVLAMIDGTVVAASAWRRDHRARSSLLSVLYLMLIEAPVRQLGGSGFIVGNHVTIRGDDGTFALVAHLQQGSVGVQLGERVTAGQPIARCGNSGNSTEPHVHAQLMDRARPAVAQGVPMAFARIRVGDAELADALPANGEQLRTDAPDAGAASAAG
jgi:hypothetical protein